MKQERIQKIIANAGICSRRAAEKMIADKRVLINGKTAQIGQKASKNDILEVDGRKISLEPKSKIYLKFNKPKGYTCTNRKFEKEKNIFDILNIEEKMIIVGRLDKNSHGLLILTNDGDLAQKITHPKYQIQKEYLVQISTDQSPKFIISQFQKGIRSESDILKADKMIHQGNNKFLITLSQGKKRQIRRMFEALGTEVLDLQRIRIGNVLLNNLLIGKSQKIEKGELEKLLKKIKIEK
ncbi:MAG TPA: pseudouridine synthase [Candidatus Pacearchaeota archaeon]|nr:pseudouridine synthase [Candidatus Pacearchaeota archaeon]